MTLPAKELVLLSAAPGGGSVLGGGERFIPDLVPFLVARDWQVTLAGPADSALFRQYDWPGPVRIEPLDFPVMAGGPLAMLKAAAGFHAFVRRHATAVFHGNTYRSLKWLTLAKVAADVPTVCHLQESSYSQYYTLRARWFSRLTDEFVTISRAIQHEFQQGTGLSARRFHLIPHGIPISRPDKSAAARTEFWSQHGLAGAGRIICMVGRTDPLKGHEVLIEAFVQTVRRVPDAVLVMVGIQDTTPGEREIYQRLRQAVQSHGLEVRVKFIPNVPNARDFMRHADVVAVPSLSEGLGRVAIEGQAEQTCVVASAVGGLVDVVTDKLTGCLVPPGQPTALADAFVQVLQDDTLRLRLAQAGWLAAQDKFSTEKMNLALESLWLGLLPRR